MRRYLARHSAEFLGGQLATDDAFAQGGVCLVLEVDEQGADLALVFWGRAGIVGKHGRFDGDRTVGDEIAGWEAVRVRLGVSDAWEDGGLTGARVIGEPIVDELRTFIPGVVAGSGHLDAVRLGRADVGFAIGCGRGDRGHGRGLFAD